MEIRKDFTLCPGRERLQIIGLDRLQLTRYRWDEQRHSNAEWELHLILEGACRVDLEEKQWEVTAGRALLIAPGQYHRPRTEPGSFERFSLAFTVLTGSLAQQLRSKCSDGLILKLEDSLLYLAREIFREQAGNNPFRQTCLEAMVTRFLIGVFRQMKLTEEAFVGNEKEDSEITKIVDDYFEKNFARVAGEQALADRLHISRRQLVRVLQKYYGMTFREKLIHTRMDYAAWQLRTTQLPVSRICEKVGYSSEAAFFKTFRQYFGMTPGNYRTTRSVKDV